MPPKTLPPQAKLNLILSYFHTTGTAHSIKDLEKALPAAAGISAMVVKDFLTALSDEGLIRVEKIGSGNWYWSFRGDQKKQKMLILDRVKKERDDLARSTEEVKATLKIEEDARMADTAGEELRRDLVVRLQDLERRRKELRSEAEGFKNSNPAEVERKKNELVGMKEAVNQYIDNLYALEAYACELTGGDHEQMEGCRKMFGLDEEMEYI